MLMAVAGCQSAGPEVTGAPTGDPAVARRVLVAQAGQESIPTTIMGGIAGLEHAQRDRLVADALARGVRGAGATFDPDASAGAEQPRVVLVLNPAGVYAPEILCRSPEAIATSSEDGPPTVAAAYCRGEEPLNAVEVSAAARGERATRRMLWRTAAELFPDDYAQTYGFDVLPGWLDLGIGGTFGF